MSGDYFCVMTFIQTDSFQVRGYETDANGRLSIPTLMNWMQESANRNALDYGIGMADLAQRGYGWILMRFRLRIKQYPAYNDSVQVITYPTFVDKFFIYRDFRVLSADGTLLAEATSVWLTFDLSRRTMVTLPDFIRAVRMPDSVTPTDKLPVKLDVPSSSIEALQRQQVVNFYHLDQNQHTNNVCYVQWLLESVDPQVLQGQQLAELDLFFRNESRWQDHLAIQAITEAANQFGHRILQADTGKEVLIGRSLWRSSS